ncbi:MAG: sulfite exporter TauE/SafE family protein [Candidatus Cloacimonetes bacterium]|nr:sulfite exporter TauE/SafE family protein [Candidatus Cloacimonadota bacterium]
MILELSVAAFFTAIISAIVGMGGGITLLAVMLQFLDLTIAVPIHGAAQLTSNTSRTILFFKEISFTHVKKFVLLLIPASCLSAYFLSVVQLSPHSKVFFKGFIAVFIFISLYFPFKKWKSLVPIFSNFYFAGILSGFFSLIVGATGPLIAPFFIHSDLKKEMIIATKACCQILVHAVKIALFVKVLNFDFQAYTTLIISMMVSVVIGTFVGKRILVKYVSEDLFVSIYKVVLTLVATKILLKDCIYEWTLIW